VTERDDWMSSARAAATKLTAAMRWTISGKRPIESVGHWRQEFERVADAAANTITTQRKQLEAYEAQLHAGRVICAWCSLPFPPGAPMEQHEALKAHAWVCPRSPLAKEVAKQDAALLSMAEILRKEMLCAHECAAIHRAEERRTAAQSQPNAAKKGLPSDG